MNINNTRACILFLSFLSLAFALVSDRSLIPLILMAMCIVSAVVILYRHLDELTNLSADHPKMNPLKGVTLFNIGLFVICVVFVVLLKMGYLPTGGDERYLAAAILSAVILVGGNTAPKLPFNRHTGLRLPWTVLDESTWIVAHRILGYISIPLAFVYLAGVSIIPQFELWTLSTLFLWIGIPGGLSYVFYRGKGR